MAGRRLRVAALLLVAVGLCLAGAGCQVSTRVSIDERAPGQGTIAVTVTFDQSALAALGGMSALSSDLDLTGLASSGWQVTGPSPSAGSGATGSGAVVTASHLFHSDAQATELITSLAGERPASSRPFRLTLSKRSTFWRDDSELKGVVDLTCGLGCFGDSGLSTATGQALGFDPAPLLGKQDPAQIFTFQIQAHLAGHVSGTNAADRSGSGGTQSLAWAPQLGRTMTLRAETESWNEGSVILVAVLAGVIVLAGLVLVVWWVWRRHFRRGVGAHSKRVKVPSPAPAPGLAPSAPSGATIAGSPEGVPPDLPVEPTDGPPEEEADVTPPP
ncbi:MAG: hypothetical protein JO337_12045 [Acidimicrobiales bacterium]|nr:hypothetical protein [Acidimicrobiales bacterium]